MSEELKKVIRVPVPPPSGDGQVDSEKLELSYGLLGSAEAMFAVIEASPLPQMAQSPKPTNQAQGSGGAVASTGK